jgi:hypothetical protein
LIRDSIHRENNSAPAIKGDADFGKLPADRPIRGAEGLAIIAARD